MEHTLLNDASSHLNVKPKEGAQNPKCLQSFTPSFHVSSYRLQLFMFCITITTDSTPSQPTSSLAPRQLIQYIKTTPRTIQYKSRVCLQSGLLLKTFCTRIILYILIKRLSLCLFTLHPDHFIKTTNDTNVPKR